MKAKEPMKSLVRPEEPDVETGNHNEEFESLSDVEQSVVQGFRDVANGDVMTWDEFVEYLEEDE